MNLRGRDPEWITTRRAIRAAIAVPVGLALTLFVVSDSTGAVFTLFGLTGLLVNADFAGSALHRARAYLLTGVGGSLALLIGWAASLTLVSAVLVTMAAGFVATFAGVFRGGVANGFGAILLVYVVMVSIDGSWSSMAAYQVGWWVAVVVAVVTALLILPRTTTPSIRPALADAFACAARTAQAAWASPPDVSARDAAVSALDQAIEELGTRIEGQRFHSGGVSQRDTVLSLIADKFTSLRLLVDEPGVHAAPDDTAMPERVALAAAIESALESLRRSMADPHYVSSAESLDRAREAMTSAISTWAIEVSGKGMAPEEVSRQIALHHHIRIFALIVEQMVEMSRVANGAKVEDLPVLPPIPQRTVRRLISAQLAWNSPWLRNALRTSIGLGIGVLVMILTGVDHGFWVLLGVISVLRFDAVGTRRFALLAIIGTVVGVAGALALIAVVGSSPPMLWLLLPMLTFLSAWAGAAVNFPSGQAAFSAMVLIALGIVAWPPQPTIGLVRIEDIAMGAGVALVVGVLLWPRGAAGYLRQRLAGSIRSCGAYLTQAVTALADASGAENLPRLRVAAVDELARAGETYDIASLQRRTTIDPQAWAPVLSLAHLLTSVGAIVAEFARVRPIHDASLREALHRASHASERDWQALADEIDPDSSDPEHPPVPLEHAYPTISPLDTADKAHALVITVWTIDWLRHLTLVIPSPEASTHRVDSPTGPRSTRV